MSKKTIKVPFEVIIRNKRTGEEMKVGDINVPVGITVTKEQLHEIMKKNIIKEDNDVIEQDQ